MRTNENCYFVEIREIEYRGVVERFEQRNAMIYRGSLGSLTCIKVHSSDTGDTAYYYVFTSI
jgi:hypothetical protein